MVFELYRTVIKI